MKKWKLILEVQKREIKNAITREVREEDIYIIITNDSLNLILGEWVVDNKNGSLEIDGILYKRFNKNSTYHSTISSMLDTYCDRYKIFSPTNDIVSIEDVIKMYNECLDKIREFQKVIDRM